MAYWAVAQIQSQRERLACHFLVQSGFTIWAPHIREHRIVRGRRKAVTSMLFPGYLFFIIEMQWSSARTCPGVIRVVTNGLTPAPVPDDVIMGLRMQEKDGVIEIPELPPRLRTGQSVKIMDGPFRDHYGLIAGMAARDRVIVLLQLLGGRQRVEMRASDVEPMATASD